MAEMGDLRGDEFAEEDEDDEIRPWLSSDEEIDEFYGESLPSLSGDSEVSGEEHDLSVPVFSPNFRFRPPLDRNQPMPPDADYASSDFDDQFDPATDLPISPESSDFEVEGHGLELGLGLGLRLGLGIHNRGEESEDEFNGGDYLGLWQSGEASTSPDYNGLRIVGFGSDSDSESEICPIFNCDCPPEEQISDDQIRTNQSVDFDWEQAAEAINLQDEGDVVVSPDNEWAFLLSLGAAGEEEDDDEEEEGIADALGLQGNFDKGNPPAAAHVIERLPSIVLTQMEVCAVCKDEISLEEKPKQLPCFHHYHADCILPWLKIRNTCPVCRHELPTDDPEFELHLPSGGEAGGIRSPLLHLIYESEILEME
ncbi:uncharacterized protein LOC144713301 [Wolffia australiana]